MLINTSSQAQKIDTDSLLVKAYYELNTTKNNTIAIELGRLGITEAPEYVDFYMVLGRAYMNTKQTDSASVYFNHVIDKNPEYKEAFSYLTKLEIQNKNFKKASNTIDKALQFYPDDLDFNLLKLNIIQVKNEDNDDETLSFLNSLIEKYPSNLDLKQRLTQLKTKTDSDRVGVNYSFTTFSRESVGPWQLTGLQYIRERKKLHLLAE